MSDQDTPRQVDAVVVGAGFGGLYMLYKLRGQGLSVRGFEIGNDVGGTWFWNRYPGARCDVESIDYSYSFDHELEQEWEWTERFATQPEILRYLNHVADRFDLRPLIAFDTRVTRADWREDDKRWRVATEQGDTLDARYLILATGSLSAAKAPDIAGLDSFAGETFSTSAWPADGVDFTGRTVGVIGTGSSAIQAIPLIAREADHVTVFQRTASYTIPARNKPLDPDYVKDLKARYAEHRTQSRDRAPGVIFHSTGAEAMTLEPAARQAAYEEAWTIGGPGFGSIFTDTILSPQSNEAASDFLRGKIAAIVRDPATAESLTPRGYPVGSKRLAVDTDYYATFNRLNVTLVDLKKTPLQRIVPEGVETSAGVVKFDTLVLAIGFDAMTGSFLRIDIRGASGETLAQKWDAGPKTYLGLMAHGFPNLFMVAGPGSPSVLSNMVVSIEQHVEWIADTIADLDKDGLERIEAGQAAEDAWVERLNTVAAGTLFMQGNSWYLGANVPGKPRIFMPFIGGVNVYRKICEDVVADDYAGFARR